MNHNYWVSNRGKLIPYLKQQVTTSPKQAHVYFFILVYALSIPFLILGAFIDLQGIIPINLPIAALMSLCPITAAVLLTRKAYGKAGVKAFVERAANYKMNRSVVWYLPVIFLIPTLMIVAYLIMKWLTVPMPKPTFDVGTAIIFFLVFFIGAICEEVGWTGYITDPLQNRYGAIRASVLIGVVWAVWHIIPYIQAHRTPTWIFWQCVGTIAIRMIIVWLYNNTGRVLLTAILCHTTVNMSEYLFPNFGSAYDPFYFSIVLIITACIITYPWDTKTLSKGRIII